MPQPCQAPDRRSRSASPPEAAGGQDQEEGEVGRGLVEHPRRVADVDPQAPGGGDVDVVVADGHVGHHLQPARRPGA